MVVGDGLATVTGYGGASSTRLRVAWELTERGEQATLGMTRWWNHGEAMEVANGRRGASLRWLWCYGEQARARRSQ